MHPHDAAQTNHVPVGESSFSYRASHDIRERLAVADPGNASWQRNLALSFGRNALIRETQGTQETALEEFGRGRDIIAQLMRRLPDNVTLSKDLAWFDTYTSTSARVFADRAAGM